MNSKCESNIAITNFQAFYLLFMLPLVKVIKGYLFMHKKNINMQLQVFKYKEENHFNDFRTVDDNGEIKFVANDVCDILGYTNASKAVSDHCKEKGITKRYPLQTAGGVQFFTLINEPNVYRLIVKSKLPGAEKFEEWLFEEVLPSIRKTGSYSPGINRLEKPDFIIRYMDNYDHVAKGHFSVINQLYVSLYARLEHAGYQIPNKAIDGKKMRPDVSVGKGFASYLDLKHPELASNFTYYSHTFSDIGLDFDARQYPNEILHVFIKYVDDVWIPQYAQQYFQQRDLKALEYLPKLLR
jgi:prophage antirepressor-like protein